VSTNPTKHLPLLDDPTGKRDRYLSKTEAHRLLDAVTQSDNPMLKHVIHMLLMTGARKREVLDAKWKDFDLEKRQWCIPINKLGRPRYVPISDGVLELLKNLPRDGQNPYVFPNPDTGKPYREIFKSWHTARKLAGLSDVRIHDLRHSFASFLVNSGRSLYEVQRILGHTQIKTTQRYAHLSQDTLLEAANVAVQLVA
jgi:integrase